VSGRRDGLGIVGIGAAACAVCCAGPVLAFLGGLTIAGLLGAVAVGVAGIVVAAVAGAGWLLVRRRQARRPRCRPASTTSAVAPPALRARP